MFFALHLRPPRKRASPERYPFTVLTARGAPGRAGRAEPESFTPSVGSTFSCKVHLAYSFVYFYQYNHAIYYIQCREKNQEKIPEFCREIQKIAPLGANFFVIEHQCQHQRTDFRSGRGGPDAGLAKEEREYKDENRCKNQPAPDGYAHSRLRQLYRREISHQRNHRTEGKKRRRATIKS